jgi:uncharacterized protein YndB with AHSA1/START domain
MADSTETTGKPFVISRVFDAPRDLVWKAWTETERMLKWWGPKGCSVLVANMDLRPGGRYHYCMHTPDGTEMWGKFIYREVAPPERLVFVNSFSDKDGNTTRHPFSAEWPLELLSTITFVPKGNGTEVTVTWLPINASETERKVFDAGHASMQGGWGGTFDQFAAYLANEQA